VVLVGVYPGRIAMKAELTSEVEAKVDGMIQNILNK